MKHKQDSQRDVMHELAKIAHKIVNFRASNSLSKQLKWQFSSTVYNIGLQEKYKKYLSGKNCQKN